MKIARRITGQTLVLKLVRDWSCMFQCVLFVAPCLELHCCCRTLSDRCSSKHRLWTCYGKKGQHRPLTNWGLETTIGERVKDLLAKHKHEHTMGRTWRMLSRFQSRRNMKDEGIDDEDSDFCWIAQKDHVFWSKKLGLRYRGHERCRGCWHLHLRHNLKALQALHSISQISAVHVARRQQFYVWAMLRCLH